MDTPLETLANEQNGDHENAEEDTIDQGPHNLQGGEMHELEQQDSGPDVEQNSSNPRSNEIERVEMQDDRGDENETDSDDGDSDASSDYEEIDPDMGPLVANRPAGPLSEAQRAYNSFANASPAGEAGHLSHDPAPQFSDGQVDPEPEQDWPRTPEDQVAITEVEPDFTPRTARRLTIERERGYDRRFRPNSAVSFTDRGIAHPRFPALRDQARQQAEAEEARLSRQARAIRAANPVNGREGEAHPQAVQSSRTATGSSRSTSPLRLATVPQIPEREASLGDELDSAPPSSAFSDDSDSDDDDDEQSVEDERDGLERGHDSQDNTSEREDVTASVAPALVEPDPDSSSEASTSEQSLKISTALAQVGASLAVPGEYMIANPPLSPVLESVPEEPDDSPLNPVDYYPRFADAYQSFESMDSSITSPKPENALRFSSNSGQEESLEEDGSKKPELAQTQTSVHDVPSEISERAHFGLKEEADARAKALQEEGVALLSSDSLSPPGDVGARAQMYMELARRYQEERDAYREERDAERQLVQELKDKFVAQLPAENVEYLQLQLMHSREQLSTANEERDRQAEKSRRYKEACEKLKKQGDAYQERINKFNTYIDDLQDRVQSLEDESQGLKEKNASLEETAAEDKEVDQAQRKAIDKYREMYEESLEHIENLKQTGDREFYKRELEKESQIVADLEEELQKVSADLRKQERQHQIEIQKQRDEFAKSQSEVRIWMEQHVSEYKKTLEEKDNEIEALKLQLATAMERTATENDVPAIALEPVPERAPLVKAQPRSIDAVLANESYNAKPQPLPAPPLPGLPEPKVPKSPLSPLPIAPSDPQPWQDRVHKLRDSPAWKAQREALRQRRLAEAAHEEQYMKVKRAAFAVTFERPLPEKEGDKGLTKKKNRLAFYENIRIRPKQQSERQLSPARTVQSELESELSPGSTDALSVPDSARLLRSPKNRGHERLSDWVED